ncbi:MAG: dihydrofolate reductase [Luteolibacter sp.]|uniref:dihydrofolate reductase n=1 Tax=Luteolibacter sp. TaxID=1962973 RepID=UPI00326571D9
MGLHLTAVVAMTPDRVIGKAGSLPWHLPEDLAFFKRTTSGHPIVMGRKTYESIGRPLPKRRNIVLTRDENWSAEGVEVIHRPDELGKLPDLDGQVFIIGGSEIYAAFLPELDDLLVSHVFENYDGDTRLAEFEIGFPQSQILESHADFEVRRHFRAPCHDRVSACK